MTDTITLSTIISAPISTNGHPLTLETVSIMVKCVASEYDVEEGDKCVECVA